MPIVYVDKDKFKIFARKPSYGRVTGRTKCCTFFKYSTDNIGNKTGVGSKSRW